MKLLSWLELVKLVETSHTVLGVASKCVAIKVIEGINNSHELPWTRGHCTVPGPQLKILNFRNFHPRLSCIFSYMYILLYLIIGLND